MGGGAAGPTQLANVARAQLLQSCSLWSSGWVGRGSLEMKEKEEESKEDVERHFLFCSYCYCTVTP